MDGLLTAVKTVKRDQDSPLVAAEVQGRGKHARPIIDLDQHDITSEQVIDVLGSHPSQEELSSALSALDPFNTAKTIHGFDIRVPSPTAAQILRLLVSTTIPDHWTALDGSAKTSKDSKIRSAILRCFSSLSGIGSLVSQIRSQIASARASAQQTAASNSSLVIRDLLSVLASLLEPTDFLFRLFSENRALQNNKTKEQVAWRELVSLVGAGKILSTTAEALTIFKDPESESSTSWIGDGTRYSLWLGRNVAHMASKVKVDDESGWGYIAFLTGRGLSLGYADQLTREIYLNLLLDQQLVDRFGLLLDHLRQPEQSSILEAVFRDVQKRYFSTELTGDFERLEVNNQVISSVAALCSAIIGERPHLKNQISEWLSKCQGGSIQTLGLRRALLASCYSSSDSLKSLLASSIEQFGDKFGIKHLSIITQNANAQIILLTAGHLKQLDISKVKDIGRTGVFLNAVSNRLAASSNRARFLGMVVGSGISEIIEEPGKSLKFDLEEMRSEEAHWYLGLTHVQDKVGSLESIKALQLHVENSRHPKTHGQEKVHASGGKRPEPRPGQQQRSKIVAIEEIDDSSDATDEDEDLIPYEKPDDDMDDDDEDPTLVQRNKPTAPVYIRDLITYLRDTENVERHHLAVTTAPSLIRRKTGFGSELAEQIEELALAIVGLNNDNKHPQFHESRLQSMIALIISQPLKMGRWFTAIFFDGDLSQVQRSAVLTALGLSAREVAGNGEEDARALNLPKLSDTSFPSKLLSPALEAMFLDSKSESPIAKLTQEMSRTSLQPLAANAADEITGPSALKVRTFSTRMEVEKKRQDRDAQRQKGIVKDLNKVLAEGFFYPLQGRFEIMMLQFSSSSAPSYNPFFVPHILTLFLQTLSLIVSTAGPHTPFLPGLTSETLSLLLSLHTSPASSEPIVAAALLNLFLAIVDLNIASGSNGEERLVTEYAAQVIELREWASEVFDRTPSGGKTNPNATTDPNEQVRTLAAGIMVRLGEVMERYQGRLMGVNSGFKY